MARYTPAGISRLRVRARNMRAAFESSSRERQRGQDVIRDVHDVLGGEPVQHHRLERRRRLAEQAETEIVRQR